MSRNDQSEEPRTLRHGCCGCTNLESGTLTTASVTAPHLPPNPLPRWETKTDCHFQITIISDSKPRCSVVYFVCEGKSCLMKGCNPCDSPQFRFSLAVVSGEHGEHNNNSWVTGSSLVRVHAWSWKSSEWLYTLAATSLHCVVSSHVTRAV